MCVQVSERTNERVCKRSYVCSIQMNRYDNVNIVNWLHAIAYTYKTHRKPAWLVFRMRFRLSVCVSVSVCVLCLFSMLFIFSVYLLHKLFMLWLLLPLLPLWAITFNVNNNMPHKFVCCVYLCVCSPKKKNHRPKSNRNRKRICWFTKPPAKWWFMYTHSTEL